MFCIGGVKQKTLAKHMGALLQNKHFGILAGSAGSAGSARSSGSRGSRPRAAGQTLPSTRAGGQDDVSLTNSLKPGRGSKPACLYFLWSPAQEVSQPKELSLIKNTTDGMNSTTPRPTHTYLQSARVCYSWVLLDVVQYSKLISSL